MRLESSKTGSICSIFKLGEFVAQEIYNKFPISLLPNYSLSDLTQPAL